MLATRPRLAAPPVAEQVRGAAVLANAGPVLAAVLVGFSVRARYVFAADFPLNDGGMFYAMIRDLQRAHFALLEFTSYNGGAIPFAYPPLGFYLAAAISDATHLSALTVLRVLPLLVNLATIVAVYLLARVVQPSRFAAVAAAFTFAVLPESFVWPIMGGGLTRSFGLLFETLAMRQFFLLFSRLEKRDILLAGALVGLSALSHLEATYVLLLSVVVLYVAHSGNRSAARQNFARGALAGCVALAVASPWLLAVTLRHGPGVFFAAGGSNGSLLRGALVMLLFNMGGESIFFPVLSALAALGLVALVLQRRRLLPLWYVLVVLVDSRGGHTYGAPLLALLTGAGALELTILVPRWHAIAGRREMSNMERVAGSGDGRRSGLAVGVLLCALVYAGLAAAVAYGQTLGALSHDDRAALAWVAQETPVESRFLVVTGNDRDSEWFPVLAERSSVATPQGYEWLPGYQQKLVQYDDLQRCAARDSRCLQRWIERSGVPFSYVYVAKGANEDGDRASFEGCCWALAQSLRADRAWQVVYDAPGALIVARR